MIQPKNIGNIIQSELPLIIQAAYDGNIELFRSLVKQGLSINTVDPRDNLTPLHIACLNGDDALVKLILDREIEAGDVDFSARSTYRPRLAWQFAFNSGHYEIGRIVDAAGLKKAAGPTGAPQPS